MFEIILEGDSKQVVEAIKAKGPTWCKYGQIVGDTLEVLKAFRSWEIGHVKQTANRAAHRLAKAAIKEIEAKIWIVEILDTI